MRTEHLVLYAQQGPGTSLSDHIVLVLCSLTALEVMEAIGKLAVWEKKHNGCLGAPQ